VESGASSSSIASACVDGEGVPLLWLRVRASNRAPRALLPTDGLSANAGGFRGYYEDPDEPAVIMAMDV